VGDLVDVDETVGDPPAEIRWCAVRAVSREHAAAVEAAIATATIVLNVVMLVFIRRGDAIGSSGVGRDSTLDDKALVPGLLKHILD
jgi:hypothetical protein